VRVVRILGQAEQLCLATNLSEPEMSAQLVSPVLSATAGRWELFFPAGSSTPWAPAIGWAESKNGVSIQIYLDPHCRPVAVASSAASGPNRGGLELPSSWLWLGQPAEVWRC